MFKSTINTTVSKIVGDLERKCHQLLELAGDHREAAKQKKADAEQLLVEHGEHLSEADRADRVAAKVKALLD